MVDLQLFTVGGRSELYKYANEVLVQGCIIQGNTVTYGGQYAYSIFISFGDKSNTNKMTINLVKK